MHKHNKIVEPVESIVSKIQQFDNMEFETQLNMRFQIGYILSGEKHFVTNEHRLICRTGDIFFLPIGKFYIENIVSHDTLTFDQITLSFNTEHLNKIIPQLNIGSFTKNTTNCNEPIVEHAEGITAGVFKAINNHYNHSGFNNDPTSEIINLANALHTILLHESERMRSRIANCMDTEQALFERTIYDNLFNDISVDELAEATNRSLTSFKNEFKRRFGDSPHRWLLHQRMTAAKMLLATTDDSVSQIGIRCAFGNTSHFIKLYRSYYEMTPAQHRIVMRTKNKVK